MRSQTIKVRNLPQWEAQPRTVHVKPVLALVIMGIAGIGLLFFPAVAGLGVILIIISIFSLLIMPDRILIQFTPEYMILYNHRDAETCTIIYWDEVVNWQYEYHPSVDVLLINLVNGTTESIEIYSRSAVARYLDQYAPGKEIKSVRRKD